MSERVHLRTRAEGELNRRGWKTVHMQALVQEEFSSANPDVRAQVVFLVWWFGRRVCKLFSVRGHIRLPPNDSTGLAPYKPGQSGSWWHQSQALLFAIQAMSRITWVALLPWPVESSHQQVIFSHRGLADYVPPITMRVSPLVYDFDWFLALTYRDL
ncbi:hypothetical protein BKA93DRAFT_375794 [Sparassis latifolia]